MDSFHWGGTILLRIEPENVKDMISRFCAIDGETVVHIPFSISNAVSHFLKRNFNKESGEVTGEMVNRDARYGLEIPSTCK